MNKEEQVLFNMTKRILKSKKWQDMKRTIDIGVKTPKNPKLYVVRYERLPHLRDGSRLDAMNGLNEIMVDIDFFPLYPYHLKKVILTHELIHQYLSENNVDNSDDSDNFIRCAEFLDCDEIEEEIRVRWRTSISRKWRSD